MTSPPLAVQDAEGRRFYVNPQTGEKLPSVTTILEGGVPKPKLVGWAARQAAQYAVDMWDELGRMEPLDRVAQIKDAHSRTAQAAADKGDAVHEVIDSWSKGQPHDPPKEVNSFVTQFVNFMQAVRPVFLETEVTLKSNHGYCGTADWIADIGGVTCLGDNKAGRAVYPEAALQVAALGMCDAILREDGSEEPVPAFGRLLVLHIRPRSWKLYEVSNRAGAEAAFLHAKGVFDWAAGIADTHLVQVAA